MEDGVNLATKIIVGDFNFAMVKMDREGGNKTHTLQMPFQLYPVKTHLW